MSKMRLTLGADRVLTEQGWEQNRIVEIENGKIVRTASGSCGDYHCHTLTLGLIDPHIHGGDGFDVMQPSVEAMERWLLRLAESGVGGVLASPYTGPVEVMRSSLEMIAQVMERQKKGEAPGARLLGAHLEGPFISRDRLGAMEAQFVQTPSAETCRKLLQGYEHVVKEITLAPEEPGAGEVISLLKGMGIRVQAGHCNATYEEGLSAFESGVGAVCHIFNASRPVLHRDPGYLTAALTEREIYCELIADLVHVHPGVVQLVRHCKGPDRLMLVSDAVPTTNLPDGEYEDNGQMVEVKDGISRIKGGGLCGGGTYLPGAVKNLISLGAPDCQACRTASENAMRWLGLPYGLQAGREALLTGWTEEMEPLFVLAGGRIHRKEQAS